MQQFSAILERHPMIWFLLGQLFISTGLYLGFEYSLAFGFMIVGGFCCAFGLALFVFRLRERPRASAATPLFPDFISAGSTVMVPVMPNVENKQATRPSDAK